MENTTKLFSKKCRMKIQSIQSVLLRESNMIVDVKSFFLNYLNL